MIKSVTEGTRKATKKSANGGMRVGQKITDDRRGGRGGLSHEKTDNTNDGEEAQSVVDILKVES